MKMKKCTLLCLATLLLFHLVPASLRASTPIDTMLVAGYQTTGSVNSNDLLFRLAEIKSIDKSSLSASERKQLRKEKRSIKSDLRAVKGGVYLSLGAILIIVLLLILLL